MEKGDHKELLHEGNEEKKKRLKLHNKGALE